MSDNGQHQAHVTHDVCINRDMPVMIIIRMISRCPPTHFPLKAQNYLAKWLEE